LLHDIIHELFLKVKVLLIEIDSVKDSLSLGDYCFVLLHESVMLFLEPLSLALDEGVVDLLGASCDGCKALLVLHLPSLIGSIEVLYNLVLLV
jgi:hypothetical protein